MSKKLNKENGEFKVLETETKKLNIDIANFRAENPDYAIFNICYLTSTTGFISIRVLWRKFQDEIGKIIDYQNQTSYSINKL